MKYASDLYEKAEQTLAQRRQKALLDWQQNRRKLAEEYPEVAEQRMMLHKAQGAACNPGLQRCGSHRGAGRAAVLGRVGRPDDHRSRGAARVLRPALYLPDLR